jgi:hypothetical protein
MLRRLQECASERALIHAGWRQLRRWLRQAQTWRPERKNGGRGAVTGRLRQVLTLTLLHVETDGMQIYKDAVEHAHRHEQRRDELRHDARNVGRAGRLIVGLIIGLLLVGLMAYGVLGFLGIIEVPGIQP